MRPFEGIRIIDITHVLAGSFSTYQLAVLGADVIKVEDPTEPDQSREIGADRGLNRRGMGTAFLAQGSNKRAITINLKTERGREILKKLAATADVLVENYRAGAFEALGLGYDALAKVNPRLIYCSISAFGQDGPRREQTAYDVVIQGTSGLMALTGTPQLNPIRMGAPVVDYSTGTTGAFAIASALFQRERTGRGQYIDLAMYDVARMLMTSLVTGYLRSGKEPRPMGNNLLFATQCCYPAKEGVIVLGASNLPQQRRLWQVLERPEMIKQTNEEREADWKREAEVLAEIMLTRTAAEWEEFLQARRIPAARVRGMAEALADPHTKARGLMHHHPHSEALDGPLSVPVAAFKFEHGGPSVESVPPFLGEHTDAILSELGYTAEECSALRAAKAI